MLFENIGKKIQKKAALLGMAGAMVGGLQAQEANQEVKNEFKELRDTNRVEISVETIIPQEVQTVAEKLGFDIKILEKHPAGGYNINVFCPSLQQGRVHIEGVDGFSVTKDGQGFTLTRHADINLANFKIVRSGGREDSLSGEPEEEYAIGIIDKVIYRFIPGAVERVTIMKDGSIKSRENVL